MFRQIRLDFLDTDSEREKSERVFSSNTFTHGQWIAFAGDMKLIGASFAALHAEVDHLDVASPVPRQRSVRMVGEQVLMLVDETFLSSPTAVPLLVASASSGRSSTLVTRRR